jgi:hypothetical protein
MPSTSPQNEKCKIQHEKWNMDLERHIGFILVEIQVIPDLVG